MSGKNTRKPIQKEAVPVEEVATVETVDTTQEAAVLESQDEVAVAEKNTEVAEVVAEVVSAPAKVVEKEPVATAVKAVAEKSVEVVGLKDHSCRIGGVVYTIRKDKLATVPQSIGIILQRANAVVIKG